MKALHRDQVISSVGDIYRSPADSLTKGRCVLLPLIIALTSCWTTSRLDGYLRRYCAHVAIVSFYHRNGKLLVCLICAGWWHRKFRLFFNFLCLQWCESRQHDAFFVPHYNDVIMSAVASQITSLTIVYSTVYSRRRSKKTSKLSATGFCEGNRWIPRTKGQ